MQPDTQTWRTEPRRVYSNDFKLRIFELATRPDANVADIARAHGVNDNVIFKWVRLWQKEGRVSRRLPARIPPVSQPAALPVEIVDGPAGQAQNSQRTTTCSVTLRHGNITLENPDPEMLSGSSGNLPAGARHDDASGRQPYLDRCRYHRPAERI